MQLLLLQQPEQTPPRQSLFIEDCDVEFFSATQTLVFYQSNGPVVLYLEGGLFQTLRRAIETESRASIYDSTDFQETAP